MKTFLLGLLALGSISSYGCQYGVDSSQRMDEVIREFLPNAAQVSGDGLQDRTIIGASDEYNCPSKFRLVGALSFVNNDQNCKAKIVLKYRDSSFASGKIKSISCN